MLYPVSLLLLAAASCVSSQVVLTQPGSMTLEPGHSLTLTCQVSGYSVTGYHTGWIRQPSGKAPEWIGHIWGGGGTVYSDKLKNKFTISRDTSISTITLNGQSLQAEDTSIYYCARYFSMGTPDYFDYWGKGTQVTISSVTPTAPTLFPLAQCGSGTGDLLTLGCLATGFTPAAVTFKWTENGKTLSDFIQYPAVQNNDKYMGVSQVRVKRAEWDSMKTFQCAVEHATGGINVNIMKPVEIRQAPSVYLMTPSKEELEQNKTASFACLANGFSPREYRFTWIRKLNNKEETLETLHQFETSYESVDYSESKLYSAVSYLQVKDNYWTDSNVEFICTFWHKTGNQIKSAQSSVNDDCGEPKVDIQIIPPAAADLFSDQNTPNREVELTCTFKCETVCTVIESITWRDDRNNILASKVNEDQDIYTSRLCIPYEEWSNGTEFTCEVSIKDNDGYIYKHTKQYKRETVGKWKRPSVYLLSPAEPNNSERVTLTCYVKNFYPKEVIVVWLVNDDIVEDISSVYQFNTTCLIESDNTYSLYSRLTMNFLEWSKDDRVYSCAVYHETVVKSTKMLVRTLDSTTKKPNLVNLSLNIPQTCKA